MWPMAQRSGEEQGKKDGMIDLMESITRLAVHVVPIAAKGEERHVNLI